MKTFNEWKEDRIEEGLRDYLNTIEMEIFMAGADEMYDYMLDVVMEEKIKVHALQKAITLMGEEDRY